MNTRSIVTVAGLALAAPAAFADTRDAKSAVDAIALYSQGAAVVQDSRKLNLKRGEQRIDWPVMGQLQPETLWLSGEGVQLSGFSLAGNVASQSRLAARVGQQISVTDDHGKTRQGQLVAVEGDTAYVRIQDRIERFTAASPARLSWPAQNSAADGDSALNLDVIARRAGKQALTATYQTSAPSWQASYTGRFDPGSGQLELTAAAVIDNSGHDTLAADQAWLVAGDTSRADGHGPQPVMMAKMTVGESRSTGRAQSVGDVYRYPLAGGLHVPAGATQSVALIKPLTVDAKRHYRFENYALTDSADARRHVRVSLAFDNDSKQPLPAGPVRIYDGSHQAQLMGGTQLDDTPAGAPVELALGSAFDVTGTHRVSQQSEAGGTRTSQVTVELFNAGQKARRVTLAERLPNGAQLADDAPETSGGSASQPEWKVNVPANGHERLRYSFTQPASR